MRLFYFNKISNQSSRDVDSRILKEKRFQNFLKTSIWGDRSSLKKDVLDGNIILASSLEETISIKWLFMSWKNSQSRFLTEGKSIFPFKNKWMLFFYITWRLNISFFIIEIKTRYWWIA